MDHAHTNYHDFADKVLRLSLVQIISHQTLKTNSKQHETIGEKINS